MDTNGFSYNSRQEDDSNTELPGLGVSAPLDVRTAYQFQAEQLGKALGIVNDGIEAHQRVEIDKDRAQGMQDAQSGNVDPKRMENLAYMRGAQSIQAEASFHTNVESDVQAWMSNTGKYAPTYNADGSIKTPASGYDPATMTAKDVLAHTQATYQAAYKGLTDPVVIKSVLPLMDDLEQRNMAVAQKNDLEVQQQRTQSAIATNLTAQLHLLTPTARAAIANGDQPASDFIDLSQSYKQAKGVMDFHSWAASMVSTLSQYAQTNGAPEVMKVLDEPLKVDGPANGIILANTPEYQEEVTAGKVYGTRQMDRNNAEQATLAYHQGLAQSDEARANITLAILNGQDASKLIAAGVANKRADGAPLLSGEDVTALTKLGPDLQTAREKGVENSSTVNSNLADITLHPQDWSASRITNLFAQGAFGTGQAAQKAFKDTMTWYQDVVKGGDNPVVQSPEYKATQATLDAHYKSLSGIQTADEALVQANARKAYLDNVQSGMKPEQARDAALKQFPPLASASPDGAPSVGSQVSPADRYKGYAQGVTSFTTGALKIDQFRSQYPDIVKDPTILSQLQASKAITLQQRVQLLRALSDQ